MGGKSETERPRTIMFGNLIFYNENINIGSESYEDVKILKNMKNGSFFPVNNLYSLKELVTKLHNMNNKMSFGLITPGSYAEKVIPVCSTLVNYIIIYCFYVERYLHLKNKYPKVKQVYNLFSNVINDLNQHWVSPYNNNLVANKFITFDEYLKNYINLHKNISEFFDINYFDVGYNKTYKNKFIEFIKRKNVRDSNNIINFVDKVKTGNVEEFIMAYTGETKLCYSLNIWLRNCNISDYEKIKYFAGPFSYALYKFAYYNKNEGIYCNKTFYRKMKIKLSDYYLYKISLGELICYPAFTSTSVKDISKYDFPTSIAIEVNNINHNDISVVLIIKYSIYNNFLQKLFKKSYVTPCINVSKYSINPGEEEYIFPPFSFFRIDNIEEKSGTPDDPHLIYMTVPKKKELLEFGLKQSKSFYYNKQNNEIYFS